MSFPCNIFIIESIINVIKCGFDTLSLVYLIVTSLFFTPVQVFIPYLIAAYCISITNYDENMFASG
jgi:hypothetical protein